MVGNDFMDAFGADMKKELNQEIEKLSKRLADGNIPRTEMELKEQLMEESKTVEKDLIAAFHKDLNLAMEKEIRRIGKRILNTQ